MQMRRILALAAEYEAIEAFKRYAPEDFLRYVQL